MATIRLQPPGNGATTRIFGRTYVGVLGTPQDVPDFDAALLEANGWVVCGPVSTTAGRPANPVIGKPYIDTTVNGTIYWDGKVWRNHSGTVV